MNEVIREFLLETHENLAQLDLDLVTLEKDATERETLARVFRTLHTVKGTAGFLGLMKLQAVAHSAESLLSRLTTGELRFNAAVSGALLATVDTIRKMLDEVEKSEQEGDGDYSSLIHTLEKLRTAEAEDEADVTPSSAAPAVRSAPHLVAAELVHKEAPSARAPAAPPVTLADERDEQAEEPTPSAEDEEPHRNGDFEEDSPAYAAPAPSPLFRVDATEGAVREAVKQHTFAVADSSIRVDVGLLDKLMTLVGELVLARNQIMQFSSTQEDTSFRGTVQRLNALTIQLQAGVMKTRMQPIGNIWTKFPRLVRDMALACGKQVRFEMAGRDTELDKTIIEAIRDPLIHMVRNAIDHGIETPAERTRRGKLPEGRLSLNAFHEGGKVVLEIADDGAGIDPQRIHDKAIQARLISREQAATMSERELLNLVFQPGFSTADKVTQFSGRGVGMSVVGTHIEKIGGTVEIESQVGRGTALQIKIPLTLAIISALTVTCGGDFYAIPQISLLELIRLEGAQAQAAIENIQGAPVLRLRGNLLPLVYLSAQLQVEPQARNGAHDEINIVVLQADDHPFGLVVNTIHDTEEIVVKPLQRQLKGSEAFAGATIMGDGKVALILDVLGLARRANVVSAVRERPLYEITASAPEAGGARHTVLLLAAPDGRRLAIPLAQVVRLEECPRSALEKIGPQWALQYRDEILPLIDLAEVLQVSHLRENGAPRAHADTAWQEDAQAPVQIVVHAAAGRHVGLIVGRILDIVEEPLVCQSGIRQPFILFTAVIRGQVTEVLDLAEIVRLLESRFYQLPEALTVET